MYDPLLAVPKRPISAEVAGGSVAVELPVIRATVCRSAEGPCLRVRVTGFEGSLARQTIH